MGNANCCEGSRSHAEHSLGAKWTAEKIKEVISDQIPRVSSLDRIYGTGASNLDSPTSMRFAKIVAEFTTVYGDEPHFFVRAPGRVNLIGGKGDLLMFFVCSFLILLIPN